ncbi:hypothetical protein [Clostridium pasteurianum]|nr:hypothetical protein [Clostridium pasteurianum]
MYSKGDVVTYFKERDGNRISLLASEDFYYVNDTTSSKVPTFKFDETSLENKYFHKGDVVSNLNMKLNSEKIGTLKLVSSSDYNPKTASINSISKNIKNNKIIYIIGLLIVLFLLNLYRIKRKSVLRRKRYIKYKRLK